MRSSRLGCGLALAFSVLFAGPASAVAVDAFDCASRHCGIPQDGSYPHLVIGTLQRIASSREGERIFREARRLGYWQALPDDPHRFVATIRAVSILTRTPDGPRALTLLLSNAELQAGPLKVGDLVRYTPHDKAHEHAPDDTPAGRAYWKLHGCVMVVCTVSDGACRKRYQAGTYQLATGTPIDPDSGKAWPGIAPVDPISLLPRR